jgi:hypothetical protein
VRGIHTPAVLILPPLLLSEVQPLFLVTPHRPSAVSDEWNWVLVLWAAAAPGPHRLVDTAVIGTAAWNAPTGIRVTGPYDVRPGEYLALVNSFGVVEIARAERSAAEGLGIARGAPVSVSAKHS